MTYEEALLEKKETEKKLINDQPVVKLIIVPQLISDQKEFMEFYKEDNYKDDLCLLFSSDDQYTVLISIK
ncbi:hypothetical protein C1637_21985 [Chryseobacterium lactis]|uniref:Uncharacterized protein n=1 Tax=Chryseobacterium lactis TaxID=1241981 RepID=A0A3G6RK49_CHRLC|nr:hypothetical protein [Chryseobacterium lactis]AZA84953.1 hypothetical protein EG342_24945 [Chryseobacterium lactis]AZB05341.1 hypothetical protein EG341_15825 [Chryseobacterium lactis]PNW11490.1 hypothetical protein C1637_21985 [Chryseobacterium lactis]